MQLLTLLTTLLHPAAGSIVDEINAQHTLGRALWTAREYPPSFAPYLGVLPASVASPLPPNPNRLTIPKSYPLHQPHQPSPVPKTFDWREAEPDCVHRIRDQGKCGSCWANAVNATLSFAPFLSTLFLGAFTLYLFLNSDHVVASDVHWANAQLEITLTAGGSAMLCR